MPPVKRETRRRRTPESGVDKRIAFNEQIAALQTEINRLRRSRDAVTRSEFKEVIKSLHQIQSNADAIARHSADLTTQFTRFAQLQAEVDDIKRVLKRARLLD